MNVYLAEFIGTTLLLTLGVGVVANVVLSQTKGHGGGWIVIATGWGLAVFIAVACIGDVSGGHINPAVTLAVAVAGKFEWSLVPGYLAAQFAGGFAGALLAYLAYRLHFAATDDQAAKLGAFSNAPAIRCPGWNLVTEIVGTFVLVYTVLHFSVPAFDGDYHQDRPGLARGGAQWPGRVCNRPVPWRADRLRDQPRP